ncbi:hypothetical protein POM88_038128 [Heracleum sosnowskyi]|uniref:F-box domain-containing protein n=1 Tax=Heracleum sosnowskyi TaxID=360622 RepID=A0AAD8MGJ2_9APIA|nr:hypothetical protein POM88_038126 [Heracleum sosnowskyi]KAK1372036.1 hypothetical protein POM88_038128 [Heracleum sosnowskyi]
MSDDTWSNLLPEILILILHNLEHLEDYVRFGCVCKSWSDAVRALEMLCWPPCRFPFLLLAEDVAPGSLTNDCEFHSDEDDQDYYVDSEQEEDSDNEQGDSDDEEDNNVSEEEDSDHNEDSDDSEVEGDDGGNVELVAGVEEDIGGAEDDNEEDEYNYSNHTIGTPMGLSCYSLLAMSQPCDLGATPRKEPEVTSLMT